MVKCSMRLYWRPSGWYVELKRGQSRSLGTKDEREAHSRFKELEREALRGKLLTIDSAKGMELKDLSDASQLIQSGVDLSTVQLFLGHSSYTTTQIYAHLSQSHLQEAIRKLPY